MLDLIFTKLEMNFVLAQIVVEELMDAGNVSILHDAKSGNLRLVGQFLKLKVACHWSAGR
jgi:hypothetical protein